MIEVYKELKYQYGWMILMLSNNLFSDLDAKPISGMNKNYWMVDALLVVSPLATILLK